MDALSGVLTYAFPFYTAIFSGYRAIGIRAQMILNRALGAPITPGDIGPHDLDKTQVLVN